jgi:hypothetical protein
VQYDPTQSGSTDAGPVLVLPNRGRARSKPIGCSKGPVDVPHHHFLLRLFLVAGILIHLGVISSEIPAPPRGVRGFKPELDAEQSGPVISGTWLPK